jgi:hypothetical protein
MWYITSSYTSVFYKHLSEIQLVRKLEKLKVHIFWKIVTGDKAWVSSTNQKQNTEVSNRSYALTEWKMCEYQNQRSKLCWSAFISKDTSIMNLFLQNSETNETNFDILKCLHSMFIEQDHISHRTNGFDNIIYFSTKEFFVSCCQNWKSSRSGLIFNHLWIFRGMYW